MEEFQATLRDRGDAGGQGVSSDTLKLLARGNLFAHGHGLCQALHSWLLSSPERADDIGAFEAHPRSLLSRTDPPEVSVKIGTPLWPLCINLFLSNIQGLSGFNIGSMIGHPDYPWNPR